MNVLLAGADGLIGRHVTACLRRAGHNVKKASRRHGADFACLTTMEAWRPWLEGVDAVVNAVGIIAEQRGQRFATVHAAAPSALFAACAAAGVKRVVQISALGADADARSPFHVSKRVADDALRALPLSWMVLRPALVYGHGSASTRLLMRLARWPRLPLPGVGLQPVQPVYVGDVAGAVLAGLTTAPGRTLDVVGGECLSFAAWLQRLRLAQGLPAAPGCCVPWPWARLAARLAAPWLPAMHPDNLDMLQRGCIGDPAELAALLGRPPTPWAPGLLFADEAAEAV